MAQNTLPRHTFLASWDVLDLSYPPWNRYILFILLCRGKGQILLTELRPLNQPFLMMYSSLIFECVRCLACAKWLSGVPRQRILMTYSSHSPATAKTHLCCNCIWLKNGTRNFSSAREITVTAENTTSYLFGVFSLLIFDQGDFYYRSTHHAEFLDWEQNEMSHILINFLTW